MKKITQISICIVALCCITSFSFADKVDDIIAKHIKAHGGTDNWSKVQSLKFTGDFTSFSMTQPFTEYKTKCGKYYFDHYKGKQPVIDAYDGKRAWTLNPWFEIDFPRWSNEHEENAYQQKAELCTPFFNYKEKGYKVEYLGKEELEGIKVHQLKLTRPNGKVEMWNLDAKTYLEYSYTAMWHDFAYPLEAETFFDDFREVNGLILPFYVERSFRTRHRVWEISNIEINPNIEKINFSMPLRKEMARLADMEGEWNVVVDAMGRRGMFRADSTSSSIQFENGMNLLRQTINYKNNFPIARVMSWSYNSDTDKYRMTSFNDYRSNLIVLEGQFENDTLRVDNTQVKFSDQEDENAMAVQFTISEMSKDRFILEFSISQDNGENWRTRERYTYTRKK